MSWDGTHEVTLTHNWDLSFGRGRDWKLASSKIADAVLGGWRLSGVHSLGSGLPFTPTVANAPLLNTNSNYVTADVIGDPSVPTRVPASGSIQLRSRNLSSLFRNKTSGRDSLRSPALYVSNLSLAKNLIPSEGGLALSHNQVAAI